MMAGVASVDPSEVEGLPVLNVKGEHLGEIAGFTEAEGDLIAALEHGDLFFFGGSTTPVAAERLYKEAGLVVLPEDVRPGEVEGVTIEP